MAGIDPKTSQPAGTTIQEQTRQALLNCENVLRAAGAKRADIVDVQVLLARPGDFAGLNEEYAKFFPSDPPARCVAKLGVEVPNLLVSIRMTAVIADS
jgi:2-iminobutanoate/2-iminopropanoate deaminase